MRWISSGKGLAVVNHLLSYLVRGYRYFLSPLLGSNCRYSPSCSDYCLQCLQEFSAVRAIWLTFLRILRCNPWSAGGIDPIPDKTP